MDTWRDHLEFLWGLTKAMVTFTVLMLMVVFVVVFLASAVTSFFS